MRCPSSVVCRPTVRRPSIYYLRLFTFQLLLQNLLMDFDETWYTWSALGPVQVLLFFGQIHPGADPGWGKNRSGGPLLQRTSSSEWKASATKRMHINYLTFQKKCCFFWFHAEIKFLTHFLDLVVLGYFNAISIDFYAVKSFICINSVYGP